MNMMMKTMCETIVEADFMIKADGTKPTAPKYMDTVQPENCGRYSIGIRRL